MFVSHALFLPWMTSCGTANKDAPAKKTCRCSGLSAPAHQSAQVLHVLTTKNEQKSNRCTGSRADKRHHDIAFAAQLV